jgi:hypothetical protein
MILPDGTEVEYDIQNKLLFIYQIDEDENEQVIYLESQNVKDLRSYLNTLQII